MSVSQKKGAISAYPEIVLIIFALALGAVLFGMANNFTAGVKNNYVDEQLEGTPDYVSETLARLAQDCWKLNKKGNAPKSDVCFTVNISSTANITESDFNRYLGCDFLPNNYLNAVDVVDSKCGGQDKVFWALNQTNAEITIKYDAQERRIEFLELSDDCVGSCCIAKCTDECDGLQDDCDNTHLECTPPSPAPPNPLCEDFYLQCNQTVIDICTLCADNC